MVLVGGKNKGEEQTSNEAEGGPRCRLFESTHSLKRRTRAKSTQTLTGRDNANM